ncbi:MAG TPA: LssY C-terminal domain-containing protein [Burkholderiales bacterium]|nr:LssY C-terminal domain-containing protein [Burkholderiales bacterium]
MSPLAPLALVLAVAGCGTWQAPTEVSDAGLRSRAVSDTSQGVRVSAAVLSAADTRRMFGTELTGLPVQPVWIEIENSTSQPKWLLRTGTDPDYFSPHEVAWSTHTTLGGSVNAAIDEHFDKLGFKNPIAPGTTRAGIIFTNRERGTKLLNVDVLGRQTLVPFTVFLPVPQESVAAGATSAQSVFHYPASEVTDYRDLDALRGALERLPRAATQGEPLNVVLLGELEDIGAAMVRRNYRRDARAPDMAHQVFGRGPDAVLRKQTQQRAPSTWIRVWRAPLTFEGRAVYVGQVGRPIGGRFAPAEATDLPAHADVDEVRNHLVQDMMYSGGLDKLGFARGAAAGERSDGLRAVLFFATRPLSLADVEILEWVPIVKP